MRRTTGLARIVVERERQVTVEGYTPEHDDEHGDGCMAAAAACYAAPERIFVMRTATSSVTFSDPWPWEERHDTRPRRGNFLTKPTDAQRIELLVKAGALIAAEIDRLIRAEERRGSG